MTLCAKMTVAGMVKAGVSCLISKVLVLSQMGSTSVSRGVAQQLGRSRLTKPSTVMAARPCPGRPTAD